MSELFLVMVSAFQNAHHLIRAGSCRQARLAITSLPEPVYELALDWYDNENKNYYYYLVRFVLDSFEYKVMYCHKAGLDESLALYREMIDSLSDKKPTAVFVKGELLDFNQLELFISPFHTSK